MKPILLLAGILALAACTANSPTYITYYLNKGYDGAPATQFFVDHGYPAGMFVLPNGGHVYRWVSTRDKVEPAQAVPVNFVSPSGAYQIVDTYSGSTEREYCEMRIYADATDTITNFAVAVDSTGKWSASRCSEIFYETYP